MENFTELVSHYYDQLTAQDLILIQFIQGNKEAVLEMTSQELADASYVSRSSVFRLINRLNLDSLAEFKLLIKQDLAYQRDHRATYAQTIQNYHQQVDRALEDTQVVSLSAQIAACRILYLYGTGNEQKLQVDIIQSSLASLGINIVVLFDLGEYDYFKSMFTDQDLLLLISYKGENEEALQILSDAQFRPIQTVAVTKTSMNSMAQLADYQLLVPTESIAMPTQRTYEINTTFYLIFDQLFLSIQDCQEKEL